jgi:hypothetical protein
MDVQTFWELIKSAEGDGKRLATLLQELKAEEVRGFGDILDIQFNKAYHWNLWAAAYLINGGCNEEEFDQFLYWLISLGEERFEKVLEDPDTLAEIVQDDDNTFNDEIIIAIARTLDRLGKEIEGKSNVTLPADLIEYKQKIRKPRGQEWKDDDELLEMFPKLGERFGEMLEWDEEEEDWDDEEKNKSKLRKAWDKFVEFFARIFDWFIKLFSKKKKEEKEGKDKKLEDQNKLTTKIGVNFWLYLAFLVLGLGFLAMIPATVAFIGNINAKIELIRWYQDRLSFLNTTFVNRYIEGIIVDGKVFLSGLEQKIQKWEYLQILWSILMVFSLIAGLPFFKLLFQHRNIKLDVKKIDFLTKKEVVSHTTPIKEIESIQLTKSNTFLVIPKKNSDEAPVLMLDISNVEPLKKYCIENKIHLDEESNLMKMLIFLISYKIKLWKNR